MATAWESFFRHVQPHLPGCPEVVIENHLRDAAIDFCERSEVWRYSTAEEFTVAGVSDYFVGTPSGAILENVVSLHVDGFLVAQSSELYARHNPTVPQGSPRSFSLFEDRQVRFFPTPDKAYPFAATVVLKPKLSASGVENFIFETHGKTIACGAIASLAVIPGKEWTNPELASYYQNKFLRSVDDAKGRDTRRSNLRVGSVHFA
jgi:hypothetical protein